MNELSPLDLADFFFDHVTKINQVTLLAADDKRHAEHDIKVAVLYLAHA